MQFLFRAEDSRGSGSFSADPPAIAPELINRILSAPNVGFAVWDEQLHYVYVNDALAKLNGVPPAAHYGRTVREIPGEIAPTIEANVRQVLTTGEPVSNFEIVAKLPTRSEPGHWIANYFPIVKHEGKILRVAVVVMEIGLATRPRSEHTVTPELQSSRLEAFLEFSGAMTSALDEEDLLPSMATFVQKAVVHDFSSITLYHAIGYTLSALCLSWRSRAATLCRILSRHTDLHFFMERSRFTIAPAWHLVGRHFLHDCHRREFNRFASCL